MKGRVSLFIHIQIVVDKIYYVIFSDLESQRREKFCAIIIFKLLNSHQVNRASNRISPTNSKKHTTLPTCLKKKHPGN